jgi:tRNA-dihydrouridine synthase
MLDERISIAPMMEWTDPHYRMLIRGMSKKTVLYTEMVVDDTVIHGPGLDFFVGKYIDEHPSVIQLGGHEPENLAKAAEICEQYGGNYSEINLNCGCPSPRVAKRCFGAKLMLEPDLVREIVYSMQRRVSVPVTVKCRIGADDVDSYDNLTHFIRQASEGGAKKFIVHARKCLLNGLSPKQNREIPPLHYETVHRLVADFPELKFIINGGIQNFDEAKSHLNPDVGYTYHASGVDVDAKINHIFKNMKKSGYKERSDHQGNVLASMSLQDPLAGSNAFFSATSETVLPAVHGVMIGRTAYSNPIQFCTADSEFHGENDPCLSRRQVLERYIDYCEWAQSELGPRYYNKDNKLKTITSCVLLNAMRNIMHGVPNHQRFRVRLNDIYMEKVKTDPNPSVRDVVRLQCFFKI